MGFVYKINNKINGKVYIGKTNFSIERRWSEHKSESLKERSSHRALYRAIRKYGVDNFTIEPLFESDCPQELEKMEIKLIKEHKAFGEGYNMTAGGDGRAYALTREEDYELMASKYREGNSIKSISKELNVEHGTVANRLREYGFIIAGGSPSKELRQELFLEKDGEKFYFFSSLHFAEYIIKNELSKSNRNIILSSIKRFIVGKRKSFLGFKLENNGQ